MTSISNLGVFRIQGFSLFLLGFPNKKVCFESAKLLVASGYGKLIASPDLTGVVALGE